MKLVVGLGNPGSKYQSNRHNVGFMILDEYAKNKNINFKKDKNSLIAIDQENKLILLKPQTYMNNSGSEVKRIMEYYKVMIEDILVIQDDKDIMFGKFKLKTNSSFGGHNGIQSIINYYGNSFLRLKIGVKNDSLVETAAFVLGDFEEKELKILNSSIDIYCKIIAEFANNDDSYLINKYNGENIDI